MTHLIEDRLRDAYQAKTAQLTEQRLDELAERRERSPWTTCSTMAPATGELPVFGFKEVPTSRAAPLDRFGAWPPRRSSPWPSGPPRWSPTSWTRNPQPNPPATPGDQPVAILLAVRLAVPVGIPPPRPRPRSPGPGTCRVARPAAEARCRGRWSAPAGDWWCPHRQQQHLPLQPGRRPVPDPPTRLPDQAAKLAAWSPDGTRAMLRTGTSDAFRYRDVDLRCRTAVHRLFGAQSSNFDELHPAERAWPSYIAQPHRLPPEPTNSATSTAGHLEHRYAKGEVFDRTRGSSNPANPPLYLPESGSAFVAGTLGAARAGRQWWPSWSGRIRCRQGHDYCKLLKWWTADTVLEDAAP